MFTLKKYIGFLATFCFFHMQSQFSIIAGRSTIADCPRAKERLSPDLQHLHDLFCADPKYYGFILRGNPEPKLVEKFTERFQRAVYVFEKMQLKAPLNDTEQLFCFGIIDYLDDPLCHDFMLRVHDAPEGKKHEEMDFYEGVLKDRHLFTHLYRHKAKERYEEEGLDEKIKERTLDLIWENRYLFATVLHDPMLENLIGHLTTETELTEGMHNLLIDRLLEVRFRLQEWDFLEYVRYQPVEYALYELHDLWKAEQDPYGVVELLARYYSDEGDPHVYKVLFTEKHLCRYLVYDLELLDGIEIAPELGCKKYIKLRMLYEKLLLTVWKHEKERTQVKYWLQLIMDACRSGADRAQQQALVDYVCNEVSKG